MSVFVIVRDRSGRILLGRPRPHPDWAEHGCLPAWRVHELESRHQWILPASHFLMYEAPDRAARRVLRKWGGVRRGIPRLISVETEVFPISGRSRAQGTRPPVRHWALCFLYEGRARSRPVRADAWADLRFFSVRELSRVAIGRDHRDILRSFLRRTVPGRPRSPTRALSHRSRDLPRGSRPVSVPGASPSSPPVAYRET